MHHSNSSNRSGGLVLSGLCAAVIAWPAVAHPEHKTETVERKVIIHSDGKSDSGLRRHGDMKVDCPGKLTEVEAAPQGAGEKKEKAKIVICSKSGSSAEAAEGLEKALARISADGDMDPAVKADLTTRLKAKIAELRAGG